MVAVAHGGSIARWRADRKTGHKPYSQAPRVSCTALRVRVGGARLLAWISFHLMASSKNFKRDGVAQICRTRCLSPLW